MEQIMNYADYGYGGTLYTREKFINALYNNCAFLIAFLTQVIGKFLQR